MPGALAHFVAINRRICRGIDRSLPSRYSIDGNRHFTALVARRVRPGARVIDVGGGKTPFFSPEAKARLGISVVGVDASHAELSRAPAGSYDAAVVGDICASPIVSDADLVVCMTVIEHVRSAADAICAMARLVRPGGEIAVLAPGRNAAFARLNTMLPESTKRKLLRMLYPDVHDAIGFPAFYDSCTPSALSRVARDAGLRVVETEVYNWSGYFDFFVPFYVVWRVCSILAVALFGPDAADRFCLVLVRPE